jgi:hypothetical protein
MAHEFVQKWRPKPENKSRQNYGTNRNRSRGSFNANDMHEDVEYVIQQIEAYQCDLTWDYADWINLGFSFAHEFGEAGRDYFQRISRFYPKYDSRECDRQYDQCLKGRRSGRTIASFFYYAKQAGIEIPKKNSISLSAEIYGSNTTRNTKNNTTQ